MYTRRRRDENFIGHIERSSAEREIWRSRRKWNGDVRNRAIGRLYPFRKSDIFFFSFSLFFFWRKRPPRGQEKIRLPEAKRHETERRGQQSLTAKVRWRVCSTGSRCLARKCRIKRIGGSGKRWQQNEQRTTISFVSVCLVVRSDTPSPMNSGRANLPTSLSSFFFHFLRLFPSFREKRTLREVGFKNRRKWQRTLACSIDKSVLSS